MEEDLDAAIRTLHARGYTVRPFLRQGTQRFEIDGSILATRQELLELTAGVYSVDELRELRVRRRAEEQGRL
jgi:hypothetical protein